MVAQRDPVEHQRRRKPWSRAFNTAALKNYEDIIVKRSRELIGQFDKRLGTVLDLNDWMGFFSSVYPFLMAGCMI